MSEITHLTVKLDKKLKELFLRLCEEEGVDISQGLRELLIEALARGYIVKERKERLQKIKEVAANEKS
jgi:antitoxin component of RelBE/YafQ-DinJ toxin-antitoxin module